MRILHITPWYPTPQKPSEAIWIKRHVECLEPYFGQKVLHLEISEGPWKRLRFREGNCLHHLISLPVKSWWIKELLYFLLLLPELLLVPSKDRQILNFHIAYPSLVYMQYLFRPGKQWLITEHWSYYHFHFYSQKKLSRVKRIFKRGIALATVSNCLRDDISTFSGKELDARIIPNCVDASIFYFSDEPRGDYYLLTAFWKPPKKPFMVIDAIKELHSQGISLKLIIAGYGPQWDEMIRYCLDKPLEGLISFHGYADSQATANLMRKAKALIIPSSYETFSVVCAEALCCGTPVIASNAGALREHIHPGNGMLVNDLEWSVALREFESAEKPNYKYISDEATNRFSSLKVGSQYAQFINELTNG